MCQGTILILWLCIELILYRGHVLPSQYLYYYIFLLAI